MIAKFFDPDWNIDSMARPTKLTPETRTAILADVANGVTFRDAALSAGIDERTFYNWMADGKKAKTGDFFQFFQAVRQAEATARKRHTLVIAKAAQDGEWRASLEYLKRHDRDNWGDNVDLTSGGEKLTMPTIIEVVKSNATD